MKVFTLNAVLLSIFFVQVTTSYARENIVLPINEEEMKSTVQSIHENVREDQSDPFKSKNGNEIVNDGEEEESNDDQDEDNRKGNREHNHKKSFHPQVCPPGWMSPWDFADNPNCCGCGGCGCCGCNCNGRFGDFGASDELNADECGCGEYGCGGGCCCGCGGCGCRFHGGRRLPRVFNDGRIQHVFLSKCER